MAKKIHNLYVYGGFVILPLEIPGLPTTITLHGEVLQRQPEFHLSIVGVKFLADKVAAAVGITKDAAIRRMVDVFTEFSRDHEISITKFSNDFRFVTSPERNRAAVFVRCEVRNLKELFAYLREKIGYNFELPPAHVTLYARPGEGLRGIGVITKEQLAHTESVADAALAEVRAALNM